MATKRKPSTDASTATATATSNPQTTQFTSRNPPWTYLKLQLIHQPNTSLSTQQQPLDPLTAKTHLTSALSQYLGLSGTAIPIDILNITPTDAENSSSTKTPTPNPTPTPTPSSRPSPPQAEKSVWIRVPRQDAAAVVNAVSSWVGGGARGDMAGNVAWRVCARGNYLGALVGGSGGDLFG